MSSTTTLPLTEEDDHELEALATPERTVSTAPFAHKGSEQSRNQAERPPALKVNAPICPIGVFGVGSTHGEALGLNCERVGEGVYQTVLGQLRHVAKLAPGQAMRIFVSMPKILYSNWYKEGMEKPYFFKTAGFLDNHRVTKYANHSLACAAQQYGVPLVNICTTYPLHRDAEEGYDRMIRARITVVAHK